MAKRRILLLVDGSDQSLDMISYISKAYVLWQTEVVLFNILDPVPDSFWDWEKDPLGPQYVNGLKDWEKKKETRIAEFMEKARQTLVTAGVEDSAIKVQIQRRRAGIARDALMEARNGYDTVAFGRTGLGAFAAPSLGSVASKLLGTLTNNTLCIVGGKPKLGRILIGLDSSAGASRATKFVGKNLNASAPAVTLVHVIRDPEPLDQGAFPEEYAHRLVENAQNAIQPIFNKVTRYLQTAGINQSKITQKVITGVGSRAAALLDEAIHGMYGTLVIGRRGVSEVVQFQMGRVPAKLMQVSSELATWIIA